MRRLLPAALLLTALVAPTALAQDVDAGGEAAMLDRINAIRAEQALSPLARSADLDAIARAHSTEMAGAGQLTHVSPTTGTPEDRLRAAGLGPSTVAENVALHRDSGQAQAALLASPPHRANMLSPDATHVGIASVRDARGVYVTQVFAGLPQAAAAATEAPIVAPNAEPAAPAEAPTFGIIPPFIEDAAGQVMEQAGQLSAPVLGEAPVFDAPAEEVPEATVPQATASTVPQATVPADAAPTTTAPTAELPAAGSEPTQVSPDAAAALRQLIGLGMSILGNQAPAAAPAD